MSIPWCPIALPVIRGHRLPVCGRAEMAVGQGRTLAGQNKKARGLLSQEGSLLFTRMLQRNSGQWSSIREQLGPQSSSSSSTNAGFCMDPRSAPVCSGPARRLPSSLRNGSYCSCDPSQVQETCSICPFCLRPVNLQVKANRDLAEGPKRVGVGVGREAPRHMLLQL